LAACVVTPLYAYVVGIFRPTPQGFRHIFAVLHLHGLV
jgi:hypothetical protein